MRSRLNSLSLMAYGVAITFVIVGLGVLAGGDANVGPNKVIRHTVHVGGFDRHVFGSLLVAGGYVLGRWVLREPGAPRRAGVELRIIALLAVLGYVAYRIGG